MFKIRMVGRVIKDAGLLYLTIVFCILYLACSLIVFLVDSSVASFGDSLWICYQAISTIGFGDILITRPAARIAIVLLSMVSIIYLAVLTGAVVSYCMEIASARRKKSLMHFMDQLEHVDELSHEELISLAQQVREFRKKNGAPGKIDGSGAAGENGADYE